MEAEDGVLSLLDVYWFQTLVLRRIRLPPQPPASPAIVFDPIDAKSISSEPSPSPPPSTLLLRRHRRSQSDELAPFPALQIQSPKLQTIFSGKVEEEDPHRIALPFGESRERRFTQDLVQLKRRTKEGESKSLSDLEFEELKGFIDLGFTFSDVEAADPRLISIVPGLQRLKEADLDRRDSVEDTSSASDVAEEDAVPRTPYLSEAWEAAEVEQESCNVLLRNWRIPAASEGIDMKDHLRLWAHAVASAVR